MNQCIGLIGLVGVAALGMLFIMGTASSAGDVSKTTRPSSLVLPPLVGGYQDVYLKATRYGTYSPNYLLVKKGLPVRIHYSADADAGCGREVIFPQYQIRRLAPTEGETLIEFTPDLVGKFPFHCSMRMFNGVIEVVS